jgi:hypothetical protein
VQCMSTHIYGDSDSSSRCELAVEVKRRRADNKGSDGRKSLVRWVVKRMTDLSGAGASEIARPEVKYWPL